MSLQEIHAAMLADFKAKKVARNSTLGSRRIIAITTNGGNREDGNIYYSFHLVVESDTLQFDEPIFGDPSTDTLIALGLISEDGDDGYPDSVSDAMPKIGDYLRTLGYTVHDLPTQIITIGDDS